VTFATDSANLNPESNVVLDTTIASLKQYPNLVIEVRGYADRQLRHPDAPDSAANRRISVIVQYLVEPEKPEPPDAKGTEDTKGGKDAKAPGTAKGAKESPTKK